MMTSLDNCDLMCDRANSVRSFKPYFSYTDIKSVERF
jgi:hypothetical protein